MRKLETKSDASKKSKRNQLIVGIILIFVMVGSTFGIIMNSFGDNSNSEKIIYNNHKFVLQNNMWVLTESKHTFSFQYNPLEVENLSSSLKGNLNSLSSYVSLPLYISSNDYNSNLEIYNTLSPFVERIQIACYSDEICTSDIPIKDCTNNLVIIREANISSIYHDNKCVFIQGQKQDLVKLTDLYLFKVLGI